MVAAGLDAAATLADRLALAAAQPDDGGAGASEAFAAALTDDLQTPRAIESLEGARPGEWPPA